MLTSDNNTVQKHKNKERSKSNKKFNNAMHKFVGVLDKYAQGERNLKPEVSRLKFFFSCPAEYRSLL